MTSLYREPDAVTDVRQPLVAVGHEGLHPNSRGGGLVQVERVLALGEQPRLSFGVAPIEVIVQG